MSLELLLFASIPILLSLIAQFVTEYHVRKNFHRNRVKRFRSDTVPMFFLVFIGTLSLYLNYWVTKYYTAIYLKTNLTYDQFLEESNDFDKSLILLPFVAIALGITFARTCDTQAYQVYQIIQKRIRYGVSILTSLLILFTIIPVTINTESTIGKIIILTEPPFVIFIICYLYGYAVYAVLYKFVDK